jgi:hypothetical protein
VGVAVSVAVLKPPVPMVKGLPKRARFKGMTSYPEADWRLVLMTPEAFGERT